MSKKIIRTKRGVFGRFNVTLPLQVKNTVLELAKESGMRKAEYLRVALVIGAMQLDRNPAARHSFERYVDEMTNMYVPKDDADAAQDSRS
jgi:hypothetical protein